MLRERRSIGRQRLHGVALRAGGGRLARQRILELRLALRFTDDRVGAPYRAFETIVSLPARFAADGAAQGVAHERARSADIGAAE